MSQQFGHRLVIGSVLDAEGSEAVPERMKIEIADTAVGQKSSIFFLDTSRLHTLACAGQDIRPGGPAVKLQLRQQAVGERDIPNGGGRFGRTDGHMGSWNIWDGGRGCIFNALYRPLDTELDMIGIVIIPPQSAEFSHAKPRVHAKQDPKGKIVRLTLQVIF